MANNYGPEPGSAEINFGRIFKDNLKNYRDELIISTKAGYLMWNGPYGDWGSRKYLIASLDQSLHRMGLDYVDIFYHHRPDPETPLEETMGALNSIVQSGKALYVGLSNYNGEQMEQAASILHDLKCPFIINQNRYSIFDRTIEKKRPERRSLKSRERHYHFQPPCTRPSHRPVLKWNPTGQPHPYRWTLPERTASDRRKTGTDKSAK